MPSIDKRENAPGTIEDKPRWEGPPETRSHGYKPAKDKPAQDRDASGENLNDPVRSKLSDAARQKKKGPEQDAEGQFQKKRHGAKNDGVSSADPEALSGKESGDATFKP